MFGKFLDGIGALLPKRNDILRTGEVVRSCSIDIAPHRYHVSPSECFPGVSQLTSTQENITTILGDTVSQVVVSCKYYDAIKYCRSWSRRQVETIEFESERTLKRRLTIDIDYDEFNQLRKEYGQCGSKCYIPVVDYLERSPLLTANLTNGGKSNIAIARRYENATIGAATLVGQVIREVEKDSGDNLIDYGWVPPLLEYLVDLEKETDSLSTDFHIVDASALNSSSDIKHFNSLPKDILRYLNLPQIASEFLQYQLSYTLFVVAPCSEPVDTGVSEFTSSTYSLIDDGRIGLVKLERYESISVKGADEKRHRTVYSNSRRLSAMTGTEYILSLPLFGRSLRGRHTRIVCPKGMVIDSVRLFSGDSPYKLNRFPDGSESAKYWSIHRGYSSNRTTELNGDKKTSNEMTNVPDEVALELVYNRKRVELHDLKLPPGLSSNTTLSSTNDYWQVQLNLSSNRSNFLAPALGLLICTMYALSINIKHIAMMGDSVKEGSRFSISSVSTLSLPLLLGLLMVGEEHRILSKALAGLRVLIGAATFMSVITACTLSVVDPKLLSNGSVVGSLIWGLFKVTLAVGVSAVSLIALHIVRIQKYRTDAFEEARYIEDKMRNDLSNTSGKIRHLNKLGSLGVITAILLNYNHDRNNWWKASWKVRWQMCPSYIHTMIRIVWYPLKWLMVGYI